jgi:hypothetical protein
MTANRVKRNEYVKKDKEKRKEKGLCRDCNQSAVSGETRCAYHKDKNAEYIRKTRGVYLSTRDDRRTRNDPYRDE